MRRRTLLVLAAGVGVIVLLVAAASAGPVRMWTTRPVVPSPDSDAYHRLDGAGDASDVPRTFGAELADDRCAPDPGGPVAGARDRGWHPDRTARSDGPRRSPRTALRRGTTRRPCRTRPTATSSRSISPRHTLRSPRVRLGTRSWRAGCSLSAMPPPRGCRASRRRRRPSTWRASWPRARSTRVRSASSPPSTARRAFAPRPRRRAPGPSTRVARARRRCASDFDAGIRVDPPARDRRGRGVVGVVGRDDHRRHAPSRGGHRRPRGCGRGAAFRDRRPVGRGGVAPLGPPQSCATLRAGQRPMGDHGPPAARPRRAVRFDRNCPRCLCDSSTTGCSHIMASTAHATQRQRTVSLLRRCAVSSRSPLGA